MNAESGSEVSQLGGNLASCCCMYIAFVKFDDHKECKASLHSDLPTWHLHNSESDTTTKARVETFRNMQCSVTQSQGCESFGFYPSIRIYVFPSSYSDGFYVTDMHLRILRDAVRGGADRTLWRKLRNRLSNETLSASLCLQFCDFKPTKEMIEKCRNLTFRYHSLLQ